MSKNSFSRYLKTIWLLLVLALFTIIIPSLYTAYAAFAAHPDHLQAAQHPACTTLVVHLHNKKPATTTCIHGLNSFSATKFLFRSNKDVASQKQITAHKQGTPETQLDDCEYSSLELWSENNYKGNNICFIGPGIVNLTDYCFLKMLGGCVITWNDQAGSYSTGCSDGYFYADTNGAGKKQYYTIHQLGSFDEQLTFDGDLNLPDHTLSSFTISSDCYSG